MSFIKSLIPLHAITRTISFMEPNNFFKTYGVLIYSTNDPKLVHTAYTIEFKIGERLQIIEFVNEEYNEAHYNIIVDSHSHNFGINYTYHEETTNNLDEDLKDLGFEKEWELYKTYRASLLGGITSPFLQRIPPKSGGILFCSIALTPWKQSSSSTDFKGFSLIQGNSIHPIFNSIHPYQKHPELPFQGHN